MLQREMSMLSLPSPTVRPEVNSEGTNTVFCALEMKIAGLRRELERFSSRLRKDQRTTEELPGYQEQMLSSRHLSGATVVPERRGVLRFPSGPRRGCICANCGLCCITYVDKQWTVHLSSASNVPSR